MERVAAFRFFAWTTVAGAYLLRERRSHYAAVA
jgi:hypothetical protein